MNSFKPLLFTIMQFSAVTLIAQVGIGTNTPETSAQLEVTSTTKGFLPPRMTAAQRNAIASPAQGLLVYQTDNANGYYYFKNGTWTSLTDIKPYTALTVCNQQWMEKNLEVTTYRNGDLIPYITGIAAWANATTGAWCYYNNDPSTNATYGKLYNWYAVNDPRGLATEGWHIPTEAEWITLINCLGGESVAGGKMKVTGSTTWTPPNDEATNISGWAGLPGGFRHDDGFYQIGVNGFWWSSTESTSANARYFNLYYDSESANRGNSEKIAGFSVRCIRD